MEQPQISRQELIGFHKGAISILIKEREEMYKVLQIVEQLMEAHLRSLKEMGIDLEAQARQAAEALQKAQEAKQAAGGNIANRLG